MSGDASNVGLSLKLRTKFFRALATTTLAAAVLVGGVLVATPKLKASGETRTISLYHIHTKENLTVTYMQDGRYVPSAMKKINYLMRDWRKDQVVTIDPRTIDLVWEMHEDLGSKAPIGIVCGYRSKGTNAFLKRIGRNVATHSQHSAGKAIDFFFPDVPTKAIRNLALYRQAGGVGYYRSAGGPTGFLHVDTAHVRHWGPHISNSQMAGILSDGRKYSGRRMQRNSDWAVASSEKPSSGGLLAFFTGKGKGKARQPAAPAAVQQASYTDVNYARGTADLADLAAKASAAPQPPPVKAASPQVEDLPNTLAAADQKQAVPLPRQKPLAVLALAAANIRITPVADEPTSQSDFATGQLTKKILEAESTSLADAADQSGFTESNGKSDFAGDLTTASAQKLPPIRFASALPLTSDEMALWKSLVTMNAATLRTSSSEPAVTQIASADERPQEINRSGKGSLPRQTYKLIDLVNNPE